MKIKIALIFMLVFLAGCQENIKPIKPISEVPDKIIPTKPCGTLYSRILELLPEFKNQLLQPKLFADTLQKNITITQETEVYLTFISESTVYQNSLGWYSYKRSAVPQNSKDFEWHILFPNVSSDILRTGDRLKLGDQKFEKGTVIGFFLIFKGWQNGAIDYTELTHFTNFLLNKDQLQQHLLFEEKICGDMVLTFEDIPVNQSDCDHDFNDIIFTISDNNVNLVNSSFEQLNVIKL
jgi:hypothetical protein